MSYVSVLVPAYNEARNISRLLRGLSDQKVSCANISEIVVVASGCTDQTHERVLDAAREDSRIRLIVQDVRMGKVSAINAFLRERDLGERLELFVGGHHPLEG